VSHPLQGYRVVRQQDGRMAFYRPDGAFAGYGQPLPKTAGSTGTARQPAGRRATAIKRAAVPQPTPTAVQPPRGRYVAVSWLHVAGDVRRAAQDAADRCADDLGITRRDVRFFEEAAPSRLLDAMQYGCDPERFDIAEVDDCLGVYRPDTPNCVWVKATLDADLAAEVAAHETRHRWQYLTRGAPTRAEHAAYEDDARRYSDDFAARASCVGGGIAW